MKIHVKGSALFYSLLFKLLYLPTQLGIFFFSIRKKICEELRKKYPKLLERIVPSYYSVQYCS